MYASTLHNLYNSFLQAAKDGHDAVQGAEDDRNFLLVEEAESELFGLKQAFDTFAMEAKHLRGAEYEHTRRALCSYYDSVWDVAEAQRTWLDSSEIMPTEEITTLLAKVSASSPVRIRRCIAGEPEPGGRMTYEKTVARYEDTIQVIQPLLPEGVWVTLLRHTRTRIVIWDTQAVRARF